MSKSNGFIQSRRGLEEHLDASRLSLFEAGVYLLIHLQANYESGIWVGSAPKILATAPRGTDLRNVQRAIERLREIGFLKVFHTHGQRGNYRALINRYEPQFGALKGMRLNADKSMSWQSPVYESCAEDALKRRSSRAKSDAEDAPIPKEEEEKEGKEQHHHASPSPAGLDSETRGAAFDVFWEQWPRKQQKSAALRSWLKIPISEYAAIASGIDKWRKSDQWTRGVIPHPATWLNQKRWQDEDIPQFSGKGKGSGKLDTNEAVAITMQGAAFNTRRPN
jgi:hypothetical protein